MPETSVPRLVVDEKVEIGASLIGVLASVRVAYHTGQTGNWEPLMATAMGLALVVLFVTSE